MSENAEYSRYRALTAALAREALGLARRVKALPSANPSVVLGLPAAAKLLGESAGPVDGEAWAGGAERYDDAVGFTRPVYHPLIVRLHLLAGAKLNEQSLTAMRQKATVIDLELWRCAALSAAGKDVTQRVEAALSQAKGALRPRGAQEQIDGWTYRELAALAALYDMAVEQRQARWRDVAAAAVAHHQQVTQPDFTTNQPWGVAAFAALSDPPMFADQQLHDARANLHLDGRSAAVTCLVLADATHTLMRLEGDASC